MTDGENAFGFQDSDDDTSDDDDQLPPLEDVPLPPLTGTEQDEQRPPKGRRRRGDSTDRNPMRRKLHRFVQVLCNKKM